MFGIPADATWIWLGLLVGSAAMFGVIADVSAAPPDAARVASNVESVGAIDYTSRATVPVEARAMKLGRHRISLRGPGGTAHADFGDTSVTPVRPGSRLSTVLHGRSPGAAYPIPGSFRLALERARDRPATWRSVGKTIEIRRVRYGEVDCVLVGA